MSKIIKITEDNVVTATSEGLVLVDFWAPWCGPCRMIAPVLEEIAKDFEDKAKICKINTDEEQDLAMAYRIRSLPTIMIMKDGEIVDNFTGTHSKQTLTDKLNSFI